MWGYFAVMSPLRLINKEWIIHFLNFIKCVGTQTFCFSKVSNVWDMTMSIEPFSGFLFYGTRKPTLGYLQMGTNKNTNFSLEVENCLLTAGVKGYDTLRQGAILLLSLASIRNLFRYWVCSYFNSYERFASDQMEYLLYSYW